MVEDRFVWLYRLVFFLFFTATCIYGATASSNLPADTATNQVAATQPQFSALQIAISQANVPGFSRITLF